MIIKYSNLLILVSAGGGVFFTGCKKQSEFLTAKYDQTVEVPHTASDCQALLDNDLVMNGYGVSGYPSLGEIGSDDYYVSTAQFNGYSPTEQDAVTWARQIRTTGDLTDWDNSYRVVFTANTVLQTPVSIGPGTGEEADWNFVRGEALFFRAFAFYSLAQVFAPAYNDSMASTDLGIPLRLTANVDEKIFRSTNGQTYARIIDDLTVAAGMLPANPGWFPTRPAKSAVYGLLSKVCLSMGNYTRAQSWSDSCLQIQSALMHYDTISQTAPLPFYRFNPEVIFSAIYFPNKPVTSGRSYTDSSLFNSYVPGDLRKKLFFKNGRLFFGHYDEQGYGFCGIATDEIYLTRAECYARMGNTAAAMTDLNTLLQTRWATGSFMPYTATDANDALNQVLSERRKELVFRGTRWTDLRRLNKDPRFAVTLYRTAGGNTNTLPPNDSRYTYAIPDNVMAMNPGMTQNLR
jgi:hypothetical protein